MTLLRDARAREWVDSGARVAELLLAIDPLRDSIEGEAAGMAVVCDNRNGRCAQLFAVPPLGVPATLYGVRSGAAVVLFEGLVDAVDLGPSDCRLDLIA